MSCFKSICFFVPGSHDNLGNFPGYGQGSLHICVGTLQSMVLWITGPAELKPGHLLVNLGFWNFRFSDFQWSRFFVWKTFPKNMLVRYRGINIKGVLERPWTKWRVLRAISNNYIEVPIYRQMLKSGLSDAMLDQILPKFERKVAYGPCAPPGHP